MNELIQSSANVILLLSKAGVKMDKHYRKGESDDYSSMGLVIGVIIGAIIAISLIRSLTG